MIPVESLENLLNDTVPGSDNGIMDLSANEVSPMNIIHEEDIKRTPKTFQGFATLLANTFQSLNLSNLFTKIDFPALLQAVILTAGVFLVFDLLVYLTAPTNRRKSLMVTPWLVQVLSASWDDLNHNSPVARSDDAVGPILRSLSKTAAKYGSRWEKSRLL